MLHFEFASAMTKTALACAHLLSLYPCPYPSPLLVHCDSCDGKTIAIILSLHPCPYACSQLPLLVHCDSCNGKTIAILLRCPGTCGWLLNCGKASVTSVPDGYVIKEELPPPTRLWTIWKLLVTLLPGPTSLPFKDVILHSPVSTRSVEECGLELFSTV